MIIPAYDEAERLPRTLEESLAHLSTTRRGPWEIIVVDDGSHDSTCEFVAARLAAEPRLRLLSSGRGANRGKGAALAAGAAAARGDLLSFCLSPRQSRAGEGACREISRSRHKKRPLREDLSNDMTWRQMIGVGVNGRRKLFYFPAVIHR